MSIVLSLKVNDGLILAADSATTITVRAPGSPGHGQVVNIYDNASKVLNLFKGLPIGFLTWGGGSIGSASIATLAKDFRHRLSSAASDGGSWRLEKGSYTVEQVALQLKQFMFDEVHMPIYEPAMQEWSVGFIVAGYSASGSMAEEYEIVIQGDRCQGPTAVRSTDECGICWRAQPEAICRLVKGYGTGLPEVLRDDLGVPSEQIEPAMRIISERLQVPLVIPAMPIQDAINLAQFLVDVTIGFSRYVPGPQVVGGPIEIAAITKHEGFKWVRRKHYYNPELNPEGRT